jgi:superfamily I DNA/RNA helicase
MFIVSVNEHIVPLDTAIDRTDKISELETMTAERCLLYVALTRAQKGVYISYYGEKSSFL